MRVQQFHSTQCPRCCLPGCGVCFLQGPQGIPGPAGPLGPQGIPGPTGPRGEDAPNADLPVIHRIVVAGTTRGGEFRPLILELDRPAPENCYLQFYRYSKKKRNRGTVRNLSMPSKYAFRGIFVDGASNPFPVIPIPAGETSVALTQAQWLSIYRPVIIRGSVRAWDEAPPGRPRWNPVNGIRDSKAIYKFGTCVYVRGETFQASLMSADTLTIIRHYVTDHGVAQVEQRTYIR